MAGLEAVVIACAVVAQFASAALALRLIPLTRRRAVWLLIALAITLMGFRRLDSLLALAAGRLTTNLLFELNGLAISLFMLAGMWFIRPIFAEMARSGQERERLIADLQAALGKIKTLKGLLPICSSCKKVRDDAGYWNQIEAYVSEHSEAEFTHSICPDCLRRLYPGLGPDSGER